MCNFVPFQHNSFVFQEMFHISTNVGSSVKVVELLWSLNTCLIAMAETGKLNSNLENLLNFVHSQKFQKASNQITLSLLHGNMMI